MSSAVNSSSSPLGANEEFQGSYEFLNADKHGVQVACSTDAEGVLVIEFSQNKTDIIYTHNFPIDVDVSFSRAVSKKANYYRVRLVNGPAAQTTLLLASIIQTTYQPDVLDIELDAATSSVTVFGTDDTGTLRAVKTTADGSLVISGGGGGGGDASSANQTLQLTAATSSNLAVCSRLDTIDVSANNMEIQLDKLQFTSGNLLVRDSSVLAELQGSNLATNTKLGLIAEASEDILLSVDGISAKMNALQIMSGKYTIEAVSQFAPDTNPTFSPPPAGIAKDEGWYYKNLENGQVSQLYFYSYLNPAMSVAGRQFAYQLNDITMSYCVVKLIAVNSAEGLPTLGIYTRPTGSGDAVPGFFKSRKVYNIPTSAKLTQGMEVMLYWGLEPSLKLHPNVARIQLQLASTIGPALGTEQLAFLSLNTDSASLAGNAEYVVSAAGFQYGAELIMDTQFTGESSASVAGGDASAANQVSSNTAICSRLDEQNTLSNNIVQILSDTVAVINYGIVTDSPPTYIPIKASNTGNLYVYDAAANTTLDLVKDELLTLNSQIDGVIDDGAGALKVVGDVYDDNSFQELQTLNGKITKCDTDAVIISSGSVSVSGDVGLVAGTQIALINSEVGLVAGTSVSLTTGSQVQLISSEVGLTAGTTVGLSAGTSIDVNNFPSKQSVFIENTADGFDINVNVTNASLAITASSTLDTNITNTSIPITSASTLDTNITNTSIPITSASTLDTNITNTSIPITSASTLDTNITNSSLDTHLYGEHNGDFIAVEVASSGHLLTNSSTQDGDGNDITSETFGGASRGLHVVIGNTSLAVTGSVTASANQYGAYANVANNITLTSSSVTAGVNVSAWTYFIGYYEDTTAVTPVGQIRVQYSFDNVTYYNLFNTQIFPSGTPRTATINKTDIPGINYLRLSNNTTSSLTGVVFTVMGGSLS
jgi:hypothetical protein